MGVGTRRRSASTGAARFNIGPMFFACDGSALRARYQAQGRRQQIAFLRVLRELLQYLGLQPGFEAGGRLVHPSHVRRAHESGTLRFRRISRKYGSAAPSDYDTCERGSGRSEADCSEEHFDDATPIRPRPPGDVDVYPDVDEKALEAMFVGTL